MIRHKFVSTVPDGPDTGKVRPSNWNEPHYIDDSTVRSNHIDFGTGPDQVNTDYVAEGVVNRYYRPTSSIELMYVTNSDTVQLNPCRPVYLIDSTSVKRAYAYGSLAKDVIGLVRDGINSGSDGLVQMSGVITATIAERYAVTSYVGGLISGATYYLDPNTPGKIVSAVPTVSGSYIVEIGKALNGNEFSIDIKPPILIN